MSDPALQAVAAELLRGGGLLANATTPDPLEATRFGAEAQGPRTAAHPDDYAFLVEAIREGYEQHYGNSRMLDTQADLDLALLAGDRLYALGLARLAELGDLEGVGILAGVISQCARAHAEGRPEQAEQVWREGLMALSGRGD